MNSGFVRVINRREVLSLAFGAMVGWSWVALSGVWVNNAGPAGAVTAFLLGGTAVILVGLTYAELASAMPLVGGEHAYSKRALGKTASFVCTWAILLGYVSVVAFEAVALPTVLEYLIPGFSQGYLWTVAEWEVNASWVATGSLPAISMVVLNCIGIRTAAKLQVLVVVIILLIGVALFCGAAVYGDVGNVAPGFVGGMAGMASVLVMVPFMFVGFDVIPQSAEEVNVPFADIGRLLVVSIVMAVLWYAAVIGAVALGLPAARRSEATLPTAEAATALFGGEWAGQLLVIGGIAGIITSWNAFLIGGSRALYALAAAGQAPAVFGVLHPKYRTPHRAIMLVGGFAIIAPLFGRPAMVWLVDAGGLGIVTAYAMVALSFLVLRKREPDMQRPYRVGCGRLVGSAALLLSVGLASLYLPWSPAALIWPQEWAIVIFWCLLGALFFWVTRRAGS
ncbi:APC family permease [Woeseia oceani]|uniref:Amino acid permease n=1 Tax=Woeseia oceani TaxID=1548547 RepID=A0A193LG35_9GAMM|nr:amino acid permease [Woeseia oceani]ANO51500.1 amino acid permease [Woeseia oceani]